MQELDDTRFDEFFTLVNLLHHSEEFLAAAFGTELFTEIQCLFQKDRTRMFFFD